MNVKHFLKKFEKFTFLLKYPATQKAPTDYARAVLVDKLSKK